MWASSASLSPAVTSLVHVVSWAAFLSGLPLGVVATSGSASVLPRLLALCSALQSAYVLLSLSFEGFFLLCLACSLFAWLAMEHNEGFWSPDRLRDVCGASAPRERKVADLRDAFRALVMVWYVTVSFFGTGNIASLNSFDPRSIQCLVSVFSPFLMASLLMAKVLLPFLVVALFSSVVVAVSRINSEALFLLVFAFSDVMGLQFFFLVTDSGSWQEIGTSLSHFVIAEATVIFLQLLLAIASRMLSVGSVVASEDGTVAQPTAVL